MTRTPLWQRTVRVLAAVGVVTAVALFGAPLDAHHTIDFNSHNCATATPTPDEEPDLTPPPTEPPSDEEGPPADEEPTPAPQNCMPSDGERIWGTRSIRFTVTTTASHPLKRVSLYILSQEERIPSAANGEDLLDATFSNDDDIRTYDTPFQWNSREITPYNGKYKIRVEAETYPSVVSSGHTSAAERLNLRVDNPPLSVDPPKIVATTVGSVTMDWKAATEPDLLSYTVYRADTKDTKRPPYSAFKPIGISTGPSYRDGSVKPGTHWYSVKVTRRSIVTPDSGISSALSAMSSPATVKSLAEVEKENDDGKTIRRPLTFRELNPPRASSRLSGVSDAPFAYKLPYDADSAVPEGETVPGDRAEGGGDPRGPVLPVAVGMFLVSSALAVGRMPY
jgi:hypothetical protein